MKAISLWQPWASLIALGEKRYETRSWATHYRGLLAIHAAKRWTPDQLTLSQETPFWDALDWHQLPLGAVIAVALLMDVHKTDLGPGLIHPKHELEFGDWTPGRWAWRMDDVLKLDQPIPAVGRQALFDLDLAAEAAVMAQVPDHWPRIGVMS